MLKKYLLSAIAICAVLICKTACAQPPVFYPVDISKACNMGFSDEVACDQKGGWTDQGPVNDLSQFPYKQEVFSGVRFKVIDPATNDGKSCIMLKGSYGEFFPEKAEVDVNRKAKHIYFLHASAWFPQTAQVAEFELDYGDGKGKVFPVMGDIEVMDWFGQMELPNGKLAWVGKNLVSISVSMFVSKFTNPNPEKEIKRMIFRSKGKIWGIAAISLSDSDFEPVSIDKKEYTDPEMLKFYGLDPKTPPEKMEKLRQDIAIIRERMYERLTSEYRDVEVSTSSRRHRRMNVNEIMNSLDKRGTWTDIEFTDTNYINRILSMAQALKSPGSRLYNDPLLKQKTLLAIGYWVKNNKEEPNWWYNQIAIPKSAGSICMLMENDLTTAQRNFFLEVLRRCHWQGWGGENLLWGAMNQIIMGCLENSPALIAEAFNRIGIEFRMMPRDGHECIQADYSFRQHGRTLYLGGYGANFTGDAVEFILLSEGTDYAFPAEKINLIANYILDGQRWVIRNGFFDYTAMGRHFVYGGGDAGRSFANYCNEFIKMKNPRSAEFAAFKETLESRAPDFTGNKFFWVSDLMTHHRKEYYASVRMFSNRNMNTDFVNDEGKKSRYIADGITYIYRTGREYAQILPVWDWMKIPGATIEQIENAFGPENVLSLGKKDFVGGVSDGRYGISAMDFERGKLTAKKAWFFFDREFVCLGADIKCPTDKNVLTTINQCLLKSDVTIADGKKNSRLTRGQRLARNPSWIMQDSIAYVFPEKNNINIKSDTQTGSQSEISGNWNKTQISTDVFTLWIDHGKQVSGEKYGYIVVPEVTPEGLETYLKNKNVEILCNNSDIQAVRNRELGLAQMVFWKSGKITLPGRLDVSADKPCLIMLSDRKDGMQISVSDPSNLLSEIKVQVGIKLEGEGCSWIEDRRMTEIRFVMPSGLYAGQSVVKTVIK